MFEMTIPACEELQSPQSPDAEPEAAQMERHIKTNGKPTAVLTKATTTQCDLSISPDAVYFVKRCDGKYYPANIFESRIADDARQTMEYYVHYIGLNRRLDEWVRVDRIVNCPSSLMGFQSPEDTESGSSKITILPTTNTIEQSQTKKADPTSEEALEREHEEITKVKYIDKLRLGDYEIGTWYFSPFPEEYHKVSTLYVCEYCLKYMRYPLTYQAHTMKCTKRHPPGNMIYHKGQLSVFEIDGAQDKLYCQFLCLMAKLFLDHKTIFFAVGPFLFYVLCESDDNGAHIVGYFSKEKESPDNNNVACIMILPPYQRRGFGKFLIAFSYELSKREGIVGSPEKPLSDLGRLSYHSYWAYTLLTLMKNSQQPSMTINELSQLSGITRDDIIETMQSMNILKYWKGQNSVCVTHATILELLETPQFAAPSLTVDPAFLYWEPPQQQDYEPSAAKKSR